MGAIGEVKGDLRKEIDKKLDPYVTMSTFGDHLNNFDVLQRKATSTDKALEGALNKQQELAIMMEANRKASTRNQADIEKIKALLKQFSGKLNSGVGAGTGTGTGQGSNPSGDKDIQIDFDDATQNDAANMVDSGQLDTLKTLLRTTERNLTLRM